MHDYSIFLLPGYALVVTHGMTVVNTDWPVALVRQYSLSNSGPNTSTFTKLQKKNRKTLSHVMSGTKSALKGPEHPTGRSITEVGFWLGTGKQLSQFLW